MLLGGIWKTLYCFYYLISLAALDRQQLSLKRSIIYLKGGEQLFFFWSSNSFFPLGTNIWPEKIIIKKADIIRWKSSPVTWHDTNVQQYVYTDALKWISGFFWCKVNIDQHAQCIFPLDQYACFFLNQ